MVPPPVSEHQLLPRDIKTSETCDRAAYINFLTFVLKKLNFEHI